MNSGTRNDDASTSNEPGGKPRKAVLLGSVPGDTPTVGAILRPPRPITVGRRKSDRLLAVSLAVFFLVASVFVIGQAFRTEQLYRLIESTHVGHSCPMSSPGR